MAGVLTGGIKLITTPTALPERIHAEPPQLSSQTQQPLTERLLLVYTRQQHLVSNLLWAVMGRWLARDRQMVRILRCAADYCQHALAGGVLA